MMHTWRIEQREYERHEARRGRRHAFEELVAPQTALVVIDMVEFFVASNPYADGVVPNIRLLADALRSAGGTVAWVLPGIPPDTAVTTDFYGAEIAELYGRSRGSGPVRDRVWPDLDARSEDVFVEKRAASAFFPGRCDLPDRLVERGIDTVLIAGTVANVCCESTARDARTLASGRPTDSRLQRNEHALGQGLEVGGDQRLGAERDETVADDH